MRLKVSPRAFLDLDDIWRHIANLSQSADAADTVISQLEERFHFLARNPESGRRRDRDLGRDLRSFPYGLHIIVYRVTKTVTILGVYHHTRNLPSLFQ